MRIPFAAGLLLPLALSAQSITWSWSNTPCAMLLSCDSGCTACNLPINTDPAFMGTNVALVGLDVCPFPVASGDNALLTYGWSEAPSSDHRVVLSGIALHPVHIDSLLVRSIGSNEGPHRLKVEVTLNNGDPGSLSDLDLSEGTTTLVFTDLGTVQADESMVFGTFQLTFTAYQGGTEAWGLDEVTVIGSVPTISTGITAPHGPTTMQEWSDLDTDLLGRAISFDTPGLHVRSGRKVLYIH
ncbi:MAG: hypothetical protein H6597_04690 [Flavobacteriales bacterium]|nr:hypothetical protein [Flavobacteriales bacterium]MCB9193811.1 hypothetical protein [Flavobacteriales bacterium]